MKLSQLVRIVRLAAAVSATAGALNAQVDDSWRTPTPPLPPSCPHRPPRLAPPNGMRIFLQEDDELPLINAFS